MTSSYGLCLHRPWYYGTILFSREILEAHSASLLASEAFLHTSILLHLWGIRNSRLHKGWTEGGMGRLTFCHRLAPGSYT